MTTPPFISACHSMMESEVGEPRRVGGPTRHGRGPIRRGALFLPSFGLFWCLGGGATSCWRSNATWRRANTTWRALLAPFWAVLPPWRRSHVALEVQRDMVGAQYDVARSFRPLLGSFGPFELEPRRVGGPTRHGGAPIRRGALVLPSFWVFWSLWGRATSCWSPNATWRGPIRRDTLFLLPFGLFWTLWARATSRWKPNATWRGPNTTWRALFDPFWTVLAPWRRSHVVLEVQRDVAGPTQSCTAFFWALQHIKSHLRTRSEVAGFTLIWFLVCLTCQLGH